ncbi:sulfonate ABC transporter substrate-binding protein [Labrys wisconsinensis]|uniref:Sulfonate transport system substrate-binding protein n=1 Tax=Labrys wisconsinensis TaxID=425677 RepID=A0ABU0JF40_9HYPH|nr:sulfonate ABC transporter substrate-binding protein [Labrys wisconsinensis]MDQ0472901.1 sulfonate transport system substrate-binding protein [Labrys wisconsinensis]
MGSLLQRLSRLAAAATLALAFAGGAEAADKVVRVGYQKYGTFLLLKARGILERKLEPLGYSVTWTEFPGGPQLLEALNVGALDFGVTGEAPPIFAQAAGAPLVYVANEPAAPLSEAILVPKDSPLKSVADLKGRKVALNKGSNVHYLLVKALEKAGLAYGDITPVFLPPADARAAFQHGDVDAWAIWDPFQASAEVTLEARTLTSGEGLVSNHQFYLGEQAFVAGNGPAVDAILASIREIDAWAKGNVDQAAAELAPAVGIPVPVLKLALSRQAWDVQPVSAAVAAEQQKIADTFHDLKLIPKPLKVEDVVRGNGS